MKLFCIAERLRLKLGIILWGTGNSITKLWKLNHDIDGAKDELAFDFNKQDYIGKANDNHFGLYL